MPVIVDHVALVSPSVATLQCNYTYLLYISQPTFPFTSTQKRKFSKKKKKKQKDPTNFSSSIWKFFPSTIPRFQSLPPFFPPCQTFDKIFHRNQFIHQRSFYFSHGQLEPSAGSKVTTRHFPPPAPGINYFESNATG